MTGIRTVLVTNVGVHQVVERGRLQLDHPVLDRLEPTRRQQTHPELQELIRIHTLHHHIIALGEVLEIVDAPLDPLPPFRRILRVSFPQLPQLMLNQLEIQLRDLVVHDEDLLVREVRPWRLQTL